MQPSQISNLEIIEEKITINWLNTKAFCKSGDMAFHASIIGIPTDTLKKYADNVIGVQFNKWRTNLRLELAMRMILDYNFTTAEAARIAEFGDSSNFRSQYVSRYGITPSQQYSYIRQCKCSKDYPSNGILGAMNNMVAAVKQDRPRKNELKSDFIIKKRHTTAYLTKERYPLLDIPCMREGYFKKEI